MAATTTPSSNICRLFISSTFRDLQHERDIISRLILPRQRAHLRARNFALQEVDLRWGVTEAMAADSGAVQICLRELEACTPFVFGMIARRVGWRPPQSVLARFDHEFARRVPPQASMTEIELRFAAHLQGTIGTCPLPVMIRSDRLCRTVATNADEWDESEQLRQWCRTSPTITAIEYDSFEEFEHRSEKAIEALFEAGFKHARIAGSTSSSRPLLERDKDLRALSASMWWRRPTLVHGARGVGISTLVAQWARQDPNHVYIDGRLVPSTQLASRLASAPGVANAAAARSGGDGLIAMPGTEGDRTTSALLARMTRPPVARRIVVDHFEDAFTTESRAELAWVPTRLPRGCQFVLATHSARLVHEADQLGWNLHRVEPIAARAAVQFAQAYLMSYAKHLTPAQLLTIGQAPWVTDLGSLILVLDELRRFGRIEDLDQRLGTLARCRTGASIADEVIDGLRSVMPAPWSQSVDHAILAARVSLRGLPEEELRSTVGAMAGTGNASLPAHLWSSIRLSLGSALAARGSLIDVVSGPVLEWADQRMEGEPETIRRVAAALATELEQAPPERRWQEAPVLAQIADPGHGLERLLVDPVAATALLDVGEGFAGGWLDRLPPDARIRVVDAWISAAPHAGREVSAGRLALLAAHSNVTEGARALLRIEAGRDASGNPSFAALRALLSDDPGYLQSLAQQLIQRRPTTVESADDTMIAMAVLAASAEGRLALNEAQEQALIAITAARIGRQAPLAEGQLNIYSGQLSLGRGKWREAARAFAAAARIGRNLGHARMLCQALERASAAELERNGFRRSRRTATECCALAFKAGLREFEALGYERLVEVERRTANWPAAYATAERYLLRCRDGLANPERALRALATLEARS